jgi:hypothetical protein
MATKTSQNAKHNATEKEERRINAVKKRRELDAELKEYFKTLTENAYKLNADFCYDDPSQYTKTNDERLLADVIKRCFDNYVYHYCESLYNLIDSDTSTKKQLHDIGLSDMLDMIYYWITDHKACSYLGNKEEDIKSQIRLLLCRRQTSYEKILAKQVSMYDKREFGLSRKYITPNKRFKLRKYICVNDWFHESEKSKLRTAEHQRQREASDAEEAKREQDFDDRLLLIEQEKEQAKMTAIKTFNDAMVEAINVAMNITDAEEKKRMMSALSVLGGYAPS